MKNQSFNDYPKAASENARRALDWLEENGNPNDCLTRVGFARANQLANRENISEDTIQRMANFRRHQQNKDVPYEEGCGGIAWDAWGGDEGISWAERKIEQINREKEDQNKMNASLNKKYYNFRNEGESAEIDIFAEIDPLWGYSAEQIRRDLNSFKGNKVVVNIHSGGGSVAEGVAIANLLKADPRHVTTRAVGIAASIASVILMAGDTVQVAPGAFVMIHNPWADVWAETSGDAETLRRAAKDLENTADTLDIIAREIENFYLDAIKARGKYIDDNREKTRRKLKDIMKSEQWLSGKAAKDLGLIDEVKELRATIPTSARARIKNQIKDFKTLPLNMENTEDKKAAEDQAEVKNGSNISGVLEAKIETLLSEDEALTREAIIQGMAEAAGISAEEVESIVSGEADCPALETLEAFAGFASLPVADLVTAAEADGCQYGADEEEDPEASDCVDCNKAKEQAEEVKNKGLLSRLKSLIGLGDAKAKEKEQANKAKAEKQAADLKAAKDQIADLSAQIKKLEANLQKEKTDHKAALQVLQQTEKALSPIKQAKNRKGQNFENVAELLEEYDQLFKHNKELGGISQNAGTPVATTELTNAVDKRDTTVEKSLTGSELLAKAKRDLKSAKAKIREEKESAK